MRRMFTLLLALTLVFSMSATAFAEETGSKPTSDYRSEETSTDVLIEKLYEVTGSDNPDLYPGETLTFLAKADESNPDGTNLTINDLVVTGNADQALTINLPEYKLVGTYKYTITEIPKEEKQGVTYSGDAIAVTVLVTYNYEEEKLDTKIVLSTKTEDGAGKVDTFVNQYDVGKLTLSKTVTGNLGAKDVYFDIEVTFTSPKPVASDIPVTGGSHEDNATVIAVGDWAEGDNGWTCSKVFKLKDSDTLTFADIPDGVSYAVVEDEKHLVEEDGFDVNSAPDTDYTATYTNETGTIASGTTAEAAVQNEKKTTVETGVLLDSMPYVLMVTAAAAGLILIFGKKRYEV